MEIIISSINYIWSIKMENTKERVLAYSLAQEISTEDLIHIAGGGAAQFSYSSKPCVRFNAANGTWYTEIDITMDL